MKHFLNIFALLLILFCNKLFAETSIQGRVLHDVTKKGIANAVIAIDELNLTTNSDELGNYTLLLPDAGYFTISFSHKSDDGIAQQGRKQIKVKDNQRLKLNLFLYHKSIDEPNLYKLNEVVVFGASKRGEKITETPAAVTAVFAEELERKARNGQLANSLAGSVGVDILRNGANDFIVNTRGFNGGLNRRILVLQDGRDVAMPLLGALEWNSFALPQEDFERIELVRGPAASLYGANAFNGVLIMKSHAPKDIQGGKASVLAGEYNTYKFDARYAGVLNDFSYKVNVGHSRMLNLINRRDSAKYLEYNGLGIERRVIENDDRETFSYYGSFRMDYDLTDLSSITSEFGYSRSGNEAYVFGLGRTFVKDAERPYFRLAYNSPNINVNAHYMSRFTPDTMWLLVPNAPLLDNSKDIMLDFQHNFDITDQLNFVWGVNRQQQYIRTYGTSIPFDVDASFTGIYAQGDWKINDFFRIVASSRFDHASIHPSYLSPRVSLLFNPSQNHQIRFSVNKAFQRPNYSELYRMTPDAPAFAFAGGPPVNFNNITGRIADSIAILTGARPDLNLNLNALRAKAVGNDKLEVEKILSYEIGYKATLLPNLYITADVYYNKLNDFITNFLPGVNPNIQQWSPNLPDSLAAYSDLVKNMVLSSLQPRDAARLSMLDGEPTFVVSNTNVGTVDEYGIEIEIIYQPIKNLTLKADYSYFGYEIKENNSTQPLLPNTSPHRMNFAATYLQANSFDITLALQYSEGFDWLAGIYKGRVPAYAILNLNGGVQLTENINLGINIFNLLNRKHYQIFGGTYLPRMASARLSVTL